jgi:hypothetical protein
MGKPGRKPLDLFGLNKLDRECFKALHRLCRGTEFPLDLDDAKHLERMAAAQQQSERKYLAMIQRLTPERLWIDVEGGTAASFARDTAFGRANHAAAVASSQGEIEDLENLRTEMAAVQAELSNKKRVRRHSAAEEVWRHLWQATTVAEVVAACGEWDKLARRYQDYTMAEVIAEKADQFVGLLADARFPRSRWADKARVKYLAAGTAGLIMHISPLTAIERLRKITHKKGHPLWANGACQCWRCRWKRQLERARITVDVETTR